MKILVIWCVPFQNGFKTLANFKADFGTLAPYIAPQGCPNGVNHILMYFRDHYHVTYQKNIMKLENWILGKGNILHECCVKCIKDIRHGITKHETVALMQW